MSLSSAERGRFERVLDTYASDKSVIVRVSAIQALTDMVKQDPSLRSKALRRLREALASGTPAERARARKLLQALGSK
jgi:hypothetical protein